MTETRAARSTPEQRGGSSSRTGLRLFVRQVMAELRKVIWPTRDQVSTYFVVVLVFVLVLIAIVASLDYAFSQLMFKVFG